MCVVNSQRSRQELLSWHTYSQPPAPEPASARWHPRSRPHARLHPRPLPLTHDDGICAQELAADLAEITFMFPFRIPPYFALIIRAIGVLEGIALVANPQARLRLEGHTDERGSREYNIALGERRAESVQRALLLRGVPRQQVTVVSYGEESPVAYGSGESAWSQNRRVEFNYL